MHNPLAIIKMKKNTYIFLFSILILAVSCTNQCETISRTYENGNKRFVDVYENCNDKNKYKRFIYFENGKLQNEGTYINGQEYGIFKRWNRKGVLIELWEMKSGEQNGNIECWHPNGKFKRKANLENGITEGEFKEWNEAGKLIVRGFYENEKQTGTWTYWEDNGTIKERTYSNDKLNGKTYEYLVDSTNTTYVTGQYENGVEAGQWKWFTEDSILYQTAIYEKGKISEIKEIGIE